MYPISLGFSEAQKRINLLLSNGHHAEGLVTTVFSFEKSIKRGLRYCALARGFSSKQADVLFKNFVFSKIVDVWPCFDRDHATLSSFTGANWQYVPLAVKMRNKLVHGERVFDLDLCEREAKNVMAALKDFRNNFIKEYNVDVWDRLPRRINSSLAWSPPLKKSA